MGMAAGQARLLTLTARLNNNELRAMQVSNAKLRLADKTQKIGEEYVNALNESQLMYSTYDKNGNISYQKLTGNALSFYGPLKNQYGLVNSAGQIMVSELDGTNFKESDNLEEFLDKYGLLGTLEQGKVVQIKNPAYDVAWDDYNKKYEEWKAKEPDKTDKKYWDIKTEITENSELYDKFVDGTASGCWSSVMQDSGALYHLGDVLSHLLDLGTYTTSDGAHTFEIKEDLNNANPFYHWWTNGGSNGVNGDAATMAEIRAELQGKHCCGKQENEYHQNCDKNETITQKVVDLLWDSQELYNSKGALAPGDPEYDAILNRAKHLVFYDLKYALSEEKQVDVFLQDKYDADVEAWEATKPEKPDVEPYIEKKVRQVLDEDKGQWYINLWHRMNGESDYKAGYMKLDKYDENTDGWISDSKVKENYTILEDGLMNSPEWLQFALEHGVVTLEKVNFASPSEEGDGLSDVQWVSTIYTSVADIVEQKDETAATKAEVRYNHQMREIEAKDKEYDNQIKLLDTEHNALQTEYESIKGTIEKNVERTFKAFS